MTTNTIPEHHLSTYETDVMVAGKERTANKMPPDAFEHHPLVTCRPQFLHPVSPKKQLDLPLSCKRYRGGKRMKIIGNRSITALGFVLSIISILRFLWITITASRPLPPHTCSSSSPTCRKTQTPSHAPDTRRDQHNNSANATALTKKEFQLLSKLISHRAPCNLLFFGIEPQYLILSSTNAGGTTIFLEDDPVKLTAFRTNSSNTRLYKVEHQIPAGEAYMMLKHAREDPACAPHSHPLEESTCKLALTKLPREVYQRKWDVVVVDGPRGDRIEAPGRMAAIYTASVIARAGNITNVVVHDVDRMIEKWFSWEFLCDENLVSSKGKLWNFRLVGQRNSTKFCPSETVTVRIASAFLF